MMCERVSPFLILRLRITLVFEIEGAGCWGGVATMLTVLIQLPPFFLSEIATRVRFFSFCLRDEHR